MPKTSRYRVRLIVLILFALISIWFLDSDLKSQLIDIPVREAQKLPIMEVISKTVANDTLLKEDHWPIRKTWFCLWGLDSWTYESTRSWSAIRNAFAQSFATWAERPSYKSSFTIYNSGPFIVTIEEIAGRNAVRTYVVRLVTNDKNSPHCGPD
jgi:hypothetical protein